MKSTEVWGILAEAALHAAALKDAADRALACLRRFGSDEAVPMMKGAKDRAHQTLAEIVSVLTPEMRKALKRELRRRGINARIPKVR